MTNTLRRPLNRPSAWLIAAAAAAVFVLAGDQPIGGAEPTRTLRDTSATDFAAGVTTGTYVAQTSDGELILAPTAASEFNGPALPVGWIAVPWEANGAAYLDADQARHVLVVDGARFATCVTDGDGVCLPGETRVTTPFAIFSPPHTLEFSARFSGDAFQHSGFAVTFDTSASAPPWAIFSTDAGGRLYARSDSTSDGVRTDLGTGLLGEFHRYRIDWQADAVDYYVDDAPVAHHALPIAGPMRPVAGSDLHPSGDPLLVDWMRMVPYAATGTFSSRVFDAGAQVAWRSIQWTAEVPRDATVAIGVRTGNTPTPDGSWSGFIPVAAPGALSVVSQFIQYRVDMTSSDPDQTPSLEDISISTGYPPIATDDSANVPANGNYTFPASGPGSLTDNDTDPDFDTLRVAAVAPPSHGAVVLNADGSVTYTPAANYFGSDAFIYTVSDGVLTASASVSTVMTSGPAPVIVPDVIGRTRAAAADEIANSGLMLGTVTMQSSATVAADLVISESPVAGTSLAAGSAVNLVVSTGPEPVRVPNVVGLTQPAASSALAATDLVVGTVTSASSPTVPSGSIISSTPAARSSVPLGSAVNLVVSTGPPPVNVPNVLSLTRAAATNAIVTAGLTIGRVTTASSAAVRAGSVISESPAAGTVVAAGSPVDLVVAASRHLLDLNSDGAGDVFLYNKATGARAFEVTTPGGGFTTTTSQWDPGWQVYPANLNADRYTDFLLYDPARGYWIQALNQGGDGTFAYTQGNWDSNWTVVPSDLDGDGLTDLFVYNVFTGVWVKCIVDGSGGFRDYAVGNWDPGWTFYTADLNGDGRDDFFLYNRVNGVWVEAFSQAGLETFDYPASGQWDPGWQVTPGDLNGDGRADLFLINAAGVHVSALSRAIGGFDYADGAPWAPGWSVSAADLNGDGMTDLFLYNAASGAWTEAFSDGAGGFNNSAPGQWDPGWTVGVTDYNSDGVDDIILSRADGTWVQAATTGIGTFAYAAGNWGMGWGLYTEAGIRNPK
ncbi:MAG: PASTA domain-containing protein [Acidobacteriota bacterium]